MPYKVNPTTGQLDYYEVSEGGGGGVATNLSFIPSPTSGTVTSDSGTDADITLATTTNSGLFSPQEKLRLQKALIDDVIFRQIYSNTAFYAIGDVVDYFGVLYQRTSSGNEQGITPPSPEWTIYDPLLGADVFDHWIRIALGNRLISQGINYQGDYNNGTSYPIDAVVSTPEGSPYGLPGQLFIRTTNPGNPGYPPGTASWEVYNIYTGSPAFDAWIRSVLQTKVTVEIGKGLSTEDYTTAEQTKLAGIAAGAEVNVNPDWNATSGDAEILNKPTIPAAQVNPDWNATTGLAEILNKPSIPAAQVNSDWLATSGLAQILNKPSSLPTANVKHSVKYGVALTIGQAVYVSSADGTNMVVSKADNSTEGTSSKTMGLVTSTGAANYQGEVITEGLLAGLNTNGATAGDPVWLGDDGNLLYGLANKPVVPNHTVFIGIVTRVNTNNGEIFVKVQNGYELEELHNVLITSLANNQVLAYDSVSGLWKNKNLLNLTTTGYEGVATLSGNNLNIPAYKSIFYAGDFASGEGYNPGDVVLYNNNLYYCFLGIGSASTPDTDPTHWSLFLPGASAAENVFELKPNYVYRGITINNNSTTVVAEGGVVMSSSASNTAQSVASTNFATKQIRLRYYATSVTGGRYTGTRGSSLLWYIQGGFHYVCDFNISDTSYAAGCQQFYGMAGQTTDLSYGTSTPILVSTLINIVGVGNENGDANLSVFHNDATGTATKIDLGVNFPANRTAGAISTTFYSVQLYNAPSSTDVHYKVTNNETGAVATGVVSTNLPLSSQGLNFFASRSMAATSVTGTGQFDLSKLGVYSIL